MIILVGAAPYELDSAAAGWLEEAIRAALLDHAGRPVALDPSIRACVQLADVLTENRERGSSPEPVEVGRLHADGLCDYVLRDEAVQGDEQLEALYFALRRFRGDQV